MIYYYEKLKKLIKTGFFHIFGSSVLNKLITFLSSVVLVRILSKSEYGVFTYAWNIYSIVLLANGMGMDSGILQVCSEQSGDERFAKRICSYGCRFGVKFDVALMVVLLGIGLLMSMPIASANQLICMLSLLPMAQLLYSISTAYLRAQKRNQDYAKITVLNTALVFTFSAIGAIHMREKGVVAGYYVAYAISILASYRGMNIQLFAQEKRPSQEERESLLSIAFVSMCNNGLSQLMYLLDIFVLGIVVAEETTLASYKVATIIPSALTFIPLSLITYLYPYFAEHYRDGEWCLKRYKQILIGLGSLNALIAIGMFIFAPFVIELFYGMGYQDMIPIFRILSINFFFSGTFRILSGNLLVTQRKLKFNLFVALVSGVVNVISDILFIQWWGAIGAAYATVLVVIVSSIMSTSYLIYVFKKGKGKGNEC